MRLKYDEFSFDKLENVFNYSIREAKIFSEIEFNYYGNDSLLDIFNESIKNNKYLKFGDLKDEFTIPKKEIKSDKGMER